MSCCCIMQMTVYVMRMSDWSSDLCSSFLVLDGCALEKPGQVCRSVAVDRIVAIAHDVGVADVEQPSVRRDVIQLLKRAQSNSADGFFGHPRRRLGIAGTARQQEQQEREGCRAHAWHLPFSTGGRRRGASPGTRS